ncbi:uncharacterized protein Z520_03127 [Fonsecaea multimorphosa CBS 102226]|uniref:Peptidase M20 dimerisation domain-containing protein n=1 Tax=Fonsecaea multimorphosa CBS 102226 TaxID=1442371 RepID=A0A0D2KE32_9EURO|nr:uncharacterized protein Z520_03127 [Fonsecaea multimorphosa CBS 102226]KIY01575.1 hypothetical protein Z520_03127 [Fonsecaea multimorphosa CBS 102226]OAL28089.1 hypothetical protein AYO22_03116 [Fonsecaea multimorphosa]
MAPADSVEQNGSPHKSHSTASSEPDGTEPSDEGISHASEEPALTSLRCRPALVKHALHQIKAPGSVQALAVDDDVIFAGTQGGNIVVWSLETYELLATVPAHKESVLSLTLSDDKTLLFSTGADAIVNVWSTESLQRLYSLYSPFEIGDVFCVVHSARSQTLFWGAQNASIQWYKLNTDTAVKSPASNLAPGSRKHRFFDSLGPGGIANVIADEGAVNGASNQGGRALTAPSRNYLPYAHKSYIYSMLLVKGLFTRGRDEEVLITGGGDGTIKLWSVDDLAESGPKQITKFKNADSNVLSLSYRGSFLYAGLSDGRAHIYNLASNQLVQKLQVDHGDVSQILVSTESILCGTSQGWIKRYDDHFAELESWQAAAGKILAMGLTTTPDHDMLVTGGNDSVVSFWSGKPGSQNSVAASARSNDELVNALREFVAYRTVALNPTYVRDCHEAVTFLRKKCNAFGATTRLLSPQEGVNPILLARFPASKPTKSTRSILFYGHYDVVDAELDPNSSNPSWNGDPFALQPLDAYLYGRGVTDNKGPILAAIYAVADLVQHGSLSCNVTFLLEGDEEAGSRGFRQTVQSAHDAVGPVDYILLSNSYWLDDHIPCLTFGMRGVIHACVSVTSNRPDLHSGMDGKSVQHEPLKDLTVLLAALIGSSATKVTIPNFYDTVDELSESEVKAYAAITSSLLPGHPEIKNEKAFALSLMQRWRYPNLTVHRIEVPEAKTAVTISGSAKATLSIRIVPSQTAEQIAQSLTEYLHAEFGKLQSSNALEVTITSKADPWLADVKSEIYTTLKDAIVDVWNPDMAAHQQRTFKISTETPSKPTPNPKASPSSSSIAVVPDPTPSTATAAASHRTSHRRASSLATTGSFPPSTLPREPLFIREGGSIPAISFLEHEFQAPAAMFPMGQASDNAHLDNERMRVENLYKGREVLRRVFSSL